MNQRLVFLALPFLVTLCMVGGIFLVWSRGRWDDRAWWQNPLLWLSVGVVFVIAGVFASVWFFVGTIAVMPLVWRWRPRHRPPVDPRTNGHGGP